MKIKRRNKTVIFSVNATTNFRSKLESLRAVTSLFQSWYKLLKIYFVGGRAKVYLCDRHKNMLLIELNSRNIERSIRMAKALYRIRDYEIIDSSKLRIRIHNYCEDINRDMVLQEVNLLCSFSYLKNYDVKIERFHDQYLLVHIDNMKWIVRRNECFDVIAGPLLPYVHEPYEYHKWFFKILTSSNDKRAIFVDVGAYIGGYALRACTLGAKVIAIEPDKESFLILSKNVKINDYRDVYLFNVAAGSKKENSSIIKPKSCTHVSYDNVLPLDKLVTQILDEKDHIKLMKIDVEGVELDVLKGAKKILKKTEYLMVEIWPHSKSEVYDLLSSEGFKIIDVCKVSSSISNTLFKNFRLN